MSKDKIEVSMNVYDIPIVVEALEEANKEIERLTKQNKALNEMYELTKKEYIRLNNIIKTKDEGIKAFTEDLCETTEELEKANNIINKMNDYLVMNIANGGLDFMYRQGFKDSYEKLQELKGSDKE